MSKTTNRLTYIIPLILVALWIAIPTDPIVFGSKEIKTHLGLDLVGGVQALLEADLPADVEISPESLETARTIIESRANGLLGVGEAVVQVAGDRRIVVELPGETDPAKALAVLGETGQLEFVDLAGTSPQEVSQMIGATLITDYPAPPADVEPGTKIWHTIMTGTSLQSVSAQRDRTGQWAVSFQLDPEGADIFGEYTRENQGEFLAIVLDKQVISAPRVNAVILGGRGSITGEFTP